MQRSNEYISNSLAIVANIRNLLHVPLHWKNMHIESFYICFFYFLLIYGFYLLFISNIL
jgi:hypothetical protein